MATEKDDIDLPAQDPEHSAVNTDNENPGGGPGRRGWFLGRRSKIQQNPSAAATHGSDEALKPPAKWSLGILNDKETDEVPGSVLLMSKVNRNEPLGLREMPVRTSSSTLPSPIPPSLRPQSARSEVEKKRTPNGQIILEPQPDDSMNDPLNWPSLRRDIALLSLGFYCMVGGGMTPVLAAGFNAVSKSYDVSIPKVALTTGFYMMGLGLGSVVASPTAIIFGKRPVYLVGICLFFVSAIWCAVSPNYASLVVARIFMGIAVSPVECLPSATIAEIFFLHERAYRLGIYTLLLLSGKNLVPLVSAAIIQGLSWQWVFWIVAMIVAMCFALIFFFVPETFWDRTPRPRIHHHESARATIASFFSHHTNDKVNKSALSIASHGGDVQDDKLHGGDGPSDMRKFALQNSAAAVGPNPGGETIAQRRQRKNAQHVGFSGDEKAEKGADSNDPNSSNLHAMSTPDEFGNHPSPPPSIHFRAPTPEVPLPGSPASHRYSWRVEPTGEGPETPGLHNFNSPYYLSKEKLATDYLKNEHDDEAPRSTTVEPGTARAVPQTAIPAASNERPAERPPIGRYTSYLRSQPPKTYVQSLKPWNGKLGHDKWFHIALRPFVLFAYPSILWSTLVYSLSIGWLIVLSESVSTIYENATYSYNFSALGTGLIYVSPFIGGILGTAVAGKVSDIIVRFLSRKNDGVYEPEFRLVMAIPVSVATVIGLMGFGWSAEEKDAWIVPTVFFGIISFGCALGSTTAITFAVDSYRQYAGEALVTLNFSKNIFHGLVFSLFFNRWLEADGAKTTFIAIGGIQLACLFTAIPMYIYGKRARMWTVRKNLMERF